MFTLSGDPDTTGRQARDVIVRNVTFNIKKKVECGSEDVFS